MYEYFDLSPALGPDTPKWPTDPSTVFESFKSIDKGQSSNVTKLSIGTHAGSHVDAPKHFLREGLAVDKLPLDLLIGKVKLIDLSSESAINKNTLTKTLGDEYITRLLIKTKNSDLWQTDRFTDNYISLSKDGAEFLVQKGVKLVGIDYLSIEAAGGDGAPVHTMLLGNGIVIVEGLDMSGVPADNYELFCLPLKLENLDGAPARVVLRTLG